MITVHYGHQNQAHFTHFSQHGEKVTCKRHVIIVFMLASRRSAHNSLFTSSRAYSDTNLRAYIPACEQQHLTPCSRSMPRRQKLVVSEPQSRECGNSTQAHNALRSVRIQAVVHWVPAAPLMAGLGAIPAPKARSCQVEPKVKTCV